ncbi:MAG: ferredoxin [Chloroflexota bacterium]|nr:ferredoxin [Chloroflexota bacterium]
MGCGRCVSAAPEAFAWDETRRVATVKPDAPAAAIERGIKACPVDAITH